MRYPSLYLAGLLAVVPVALAAQDAAPAGTNGRVTAALDAAMEAGIPTSLLERKIAEGRAKGVPMERIAAAVEARLEALVAARDALASAGVEQATEGELAAGADAVTAGVSATALSAVSQSTPEDGRMVAIAILTDLVAQGQASERALAAVQGAFAGGPDAVADLRARTAAGVQAGAGVGAGAGTGVGAGVGAGAQVRGELGVPRGE